MNDSSKIKMLATTTILMVVVNITIIGFIWFNPHLTRPDRGGPASVILEKLRFDDNQRKQFELLKQEHQKMMRSINDRDHQDRQALFDLIRSGQDSSSVSDSLLSEMAQIKKESETATFQHLVKLRKICTPDQQRQFDGIVLDLFDRRPGPPPADRP